MGVPTNYVSLRSFYGFEPFFAENLRKSSHIFKTMGRVLEYKFVLNPNLGSDFKNET
ncbi:hypothetical protein LSS_13714 [Leptospira santarosai serovar Shermani str. LT 821]|uniref:Uncharacterized protein n=1 Tax=Leptospira santarosai serovar Shermani str. LT 821 TaxID=758847 RepID=K8XZ78_9LEPT|nr:hypothetical protein LSS_13714 [Leptospira santarosai serovar Shermani str. LT 821]